jgi:hypothetical protein
LRRLVADRRGDILLAQGKTRKAKAAFLKARAAMDEKVDYRRLIDAKLHVLGVDPAASSAGPSGGRFCAPAVSAALPFLRVERVRCACHSDELDCRGVGAGLDTSPARQRERGGRVRRCQLHATGAAASASAKKVRRRSMRARLARGLPRRQPQRRPYCSPPARDRADQAQSAGAADAAAGRRAGVERAGRRRAVSAHGERRPRARRRCAASDGTVVALDLESGRELWRAQAGGALGAGVGSDGRFAAVVTRGGELVAVEAGRCAGASPSAPA